MICLFPSLSLSIYKYIGLMSRVFANGPGDWGSIPGQVIPKTQKMVLDAALLKTQHYKVQIKGKVAVAIEKGAFGSPSTKVVNFTYLHINIYVTSPHKSDAKQGKLLSRLTGFPSPRPVAKPK